MIEFKRRTDMSKDEIMKRVCELNGMKYIAPENRKSVNYIEILDDDGEPFIITRDGIVINKYVDGKTQPNFENYKKKFLFKRVISYMAILFASVVFLLPFTKKLYSREA